jgi:hypothetical protein
MGYGIRDLSKTDPRINPEYMKHGLGEKWLSTKEFVKWALDNFDLWRAAALREGPMYSAKETKDINSHIQFDIRLMAAESKSKISTMLDPASAILHKNCDYSWSGTLLFVPPSQKNWYRFDDTLDSYEARSGMRSSTVQPASMRCGLYPWNGSMIRIRPPKRSVWLPGHKWVSREGDALGPTWLESGVWSQFTGGWDPKLPPTTSGRKLQHFRRDFRPRIPSPVIALVYWSEIAKDPMAFLNELRPMIHTYWD